MLLVRGNHDRHAGLPLALNTPGVGLTPEFIFMDSSVLIKEDILFKFDNLLFNDRIFKFSSEALHFQLILRQKKTSV